MQKPNIIFILIDDLGWRDLGCYGSEFYETPNIDKLAREGIRFTDAYASCPVCSPTRASILSGKFPANVGVTNYIAVANEHPSKGRILIDAPYIDHLPLSEISLASALKAGGYQTWHIGKWHLGGREYYPDRHGFDVNIGGCHWGYPVGGYYSPYGNEMIEDGPEGEYLNDRLTDDAIKLIESAGDKPFFLNLWHYAVHGPIQSPEELVEKYTKKRAEMGLEGVREFEEGDFFPTDYKKNQRIIRRIVQSNPDYAAMIENLDSNVGRIMDKLTELQIEDNTIVIFYSDNGGLSTAEGSPTCNAPLCEGKGWMYEGGTRVPLIIKWKSVIKAGGVSNEIVTSTDFYPTILSAAGLPLIPAQHQDGVSLMPIFEGHRIDREAVYWHYPHHGNQGGTPGASVRMGDYKLIEFFEDESCELYNIAEDIEENYNLAEELPELTQKMKKMLHNWQDSMNAKFPARRHEDENNWNQERFR